MEVKINKETYLTLEKLKVDKGKSIEEAIELIVKNTIENGIEITYMEDCIGKKLVKFNPSPSLMEDIENKALLEILEPEELVRKILKAQCFLYETVPNFFKL